MGQSSLLNFNFDGDDLNDDKLTLRVFAATLPDGDYEVDNWHVGSGPRTISPVAPFSNPFRIEPGKVVYLGHFHFTQTAGMGPSVTGAKGAYLDETERDLAILRKMYSRFADIPIATAITRGTRQEDLVVAGNTAPTLTVFVPMVHR